MKKYTAPELEVVELSDVICLSNIFTDNGNGDYTTDAEDFFGISIF